MEWPPVGFSMARADLRNIDSDKLQPKEGQLAEPDRVRSFFPETWLWNMYDVGCVTCCIIEQICITKPLIVIILA